MQRSGSVLQADSSISHPTLSQFTTCPTPPYTPVYPRQNPLGWAAKAMHLNRTVTVGTYGRCGCCSGRLIQYFARIWWCCLSRALASAANGTNDTQSEPPSPGSPVRHFRLCKKRKNVFKRVQRAAISVDEDFWLHIFLYISAFVLNSFYW